jgi:uncharacterized protein
MNRSSSLQNRITSLKNLISHIWGDEKPLCLLFSTEKNNYLYDTGTNNILRCENYEFDLLQNLISLDPVNAINKFLSTSSVQDAIKAILSIEEIIKNKNILNVTKIDSFGLSRDYDYVIDQINNELGMIQLELTENCNLRCGYCIYNENYKENRNHSSHFMPEQIARKAIDNLKKQSKKKKSVGVAFYGGEPLLNYKLLQKSVSYAKSILKDKELHFTITTNGTLINNEIAQYLYKENFGILVSLDGPKEIHDSWRRDMKNRGSYERTSRGLKFLSKVYKKDSHKLGLSMVYTPPYSAEKVVKIANFLTSNWIPNDSRIYITYPQDGTVSDGFNNKEINSHIDTSLSDWARNRFLNDYKRNTKSHPLANAGLEKKLAKLLQRPIIDRRIRKAHLNGCCTPGARKNYITATGNIRVCERVGNAPVIGNVDEGINSEIIKNIYLDEYSEKSIKHCSMCWLVRLCNLCYQQAFYNNKINMINKNKYCLMSKFDAKKTLIYFCSLLEINDKRLDYLYEWEFS